MDEYSITLEQFNEGMDRLAAELDAADAEADRAQQRCSITCTCGGCLREQGWESRNHFNAGR